jgi:murein DD-endopeptidase MepM/ murein hydrolase activator NlpD
LVSRASDLNLIAGDWNVTPTAQNAYVFSGGWFKQKILAFLEATGLFEAQVYAAGLYYPSGTEPIPLEGGFTHPYPGSSECGVYRYGVPVANGVHWGIDLCVGNPWGSAPIYAMHSGRVTFARYLSPSESLAGQWWISGNVVAIEGTDSEGNTVWTVYGHGLNNTMQVKDGDYVEKGQMLMMSGNTGFSDGIHLHLGMKINGGWVNPSTYLTGD